MREPSSLSHVFLITLHFEATGLEMLLIWPVARGVLVAQVGEGLGFGGALCALSAILMLFLRHFGF